MIKFGILDIRAKLNNEENCNIEMQVVDQKDIEKRILFYWSKLYYSGINEGEGYRKLKKTIVILIANFDVDAIKEVPKYHTKWEIREEEYSKVILTEALEIHIIELLKLTKQLKEGIISSDDKVALWAQFIINPEILGEDVMSKNEDIKMANEELEKLKQDEKEEWLAFSRLMYRMDKKAGEEYAYEEGIKEGIEDTQKEVVCNLYKMQMKIEDICKVVKLDKEEVEKIINKNIKVLISD